MADIKISELPAASSVAATDEFELNQSGTSRKATTAQIFTNSIFSGDIGIGTSNPSAKLEVVGGILSGLNDTVWLSGGAGSVLGTGPRLVFHHQYGTNDFPTWRLAEIGAVYDDNQVNTYDGALVLRTNTGTSVTDVSEKIRITGAGNVGIGTTAPDKKLTVWGGDHNIVDPTDLGAESLTNPNLTGGTSWTATNDCALVNEATWTFSAGTASTLTQTSAALAVAGVGSRWYRFTYTVSGITGSPAANITTGFALATTALTITAGAQTIYFRSAASPGDFVITATLIAGQAFVLDTFSLKEVQGGDLIVHGIITGGGTAGIKVLANNNVGIGTTSPSAKLAINGGLHVGGDSDPGDNNALIDGTLGVTGTIKPGGYTVGTLPAAAAGEIAYVTDQLTAVNAKGVAPTGGGAVVAMQMYAAAWVGI